MKLSFKSLNNLPYDFYFLVVDKFLDVNLHHRLKNFYHLYPFNFSKAFKPGFWINKNYQNNFIVNSGQLLNNPQISQFIKNESSKKLHQPVIIPFKPSFRIEKICQKNGWLLAAPPAKINRFLENKVNFYHFCQKNKLPTIPALINTFNHQHYLQFAADNPFPFVVQKQQGWAGKSSFLTFSWNDIKNAIAANTQVKFTPYLNGYTLINNCCLTQNGLIQSPPGLQYTGLKEFTQNPLSTVGRQWPSFAPKEVEKQVVSISSNFAKAIKKLNYLGFFGLDFLVVNNKVYLLECNPRLTASFSFYTEKQLALSQNPLFIFHLSSYLPVRFEFDSTIETNKLFIQPVIGTQASPRDPSGKVTRIITCSTPLTKNPHEPPRF